MDKERFDDLVRRLAEERNRRSVLTGVGGAVVASFGLASDSDAAASTRKGKDKKQAAAAADGKKAGKKGKEKGKGKGSDRSPDELQKPGVGTEGPCGSGSRKDNICTKDSECCTSICDIQLGKKNKDKKGRCRCVRRGGACTADNNCCNSICISGVCGYLS